MSIPTAAKPTPIDRPNINVPAIDRETGHWSSEELQRQSKVRNYVVGMGRIIPCFASGTNTLTLTPNGHGDEDGESPVLEGDYKFGDVFLFYAAETSTGSVTARVQAKHGYLSTIKVFITGGAAQAGAGDITQNRVYLGVYAPHLDSNAGGLVLK